MKSSKGMRRGKKGSRNEMERDAVFVDLRGYFKERTSSAVLLGILVGTFLMACVFVTAVIFTGYHLTQ